MRSTARPAGTDIDATPSSFVRPTRLNMESGVARVLSAANSITAPLRTRALLSAMTAQMTTPPVGTGGPAGSVGDEARRTSRGAA
jgi:hypothetical protein